MTKWTWIETNSTEFEQRKITGEASESLHNCPATLFFILITTLTLDSRPTAQPRRRRRGPPHADLLPDQLADPAGAVHPVERVAHCGRDGGEAGSAVVWVTIQ